jgi:histidine triad (HIT) family protein
MRNNDCLFCKIINGEIPSEQVHKDKLLVAFRDINPVAPCHILVVPIKHIQDNNNFSAVDEKIAGRMFTVVKELAIKEGIAQNGYRLIMNTGKHGRQEVPHMHLHLIGGKRMEHKLG